jgi:hypothetical protein
MKKNTLAAGIKAAAAGKSESASPKPRPKGKPAKVAETSTSTVLIGGHFPPEVRSTLFLLQAEPRNTGKNLKQLLGEAINDLCVKYGRPQPYSGEA